jgi:drug/metabolite transporter (DMT)-like permease
MNAHPVRNCEVVSRWALADSPAVSQQSAPVEPKQSALSGLTAEGTHREAFTQRDWILFAGPALIWGASFLLIAEGLDKFAPGVVTWLRIAFGCLTLGLTKRSRVPIDRSAWPRIVAVSLTWLAIPMTLFPLAQQHISSSLAGMLNGGIPIFAAIFASILLRRLPGPYQLAGLGLGILGMILIGIPAINDGASSAYGVGLVVFSIMLYGIAVNISVPLTQQYGSIPVFWRCQLVAVVLTAPFAVFGLKDSTWGLRAFSASVALGVLGTAVAFVMMTMLAARVGSTRASVLTYAEAVIALGLGVAIRNDTVRGLEIAGCAVILLGAWLSGRADP